MKGPLSRRTLILVALIIVGCIIWLSCLPKAEAQECQLEQWTVKISHLSTCSQLALEVYNYVPRITIEVLFSDGTISHITVPVTKPNNYAWFSDSRMRAFRFVGDQRVCNESAWLTNQDRWYYWTPIQVSSDGCSVTIRHWANQPHYMTLVPAGEHREVVLEYSQSCEFGSATTWNKGFTTIDGEFIPFRAGTYDILLHQSVDWFPGPGPVFAETLVELSGCHKAYISLVY